MATDSKSANDLVTASAAASAASALAARADLKVNADTVAVRLQLISEIKDNTLNFNTRDRKPKITSEEFIALLALIRENHPLLKDLNLKECKLNPTQVKNLAEALRQNTTLTCLDLSHNDCGDEGAIAIANTLNTNNTLRKLFLEYSKIGVNGVEAIARALEANAGLRVLNLERNNLNPAIGIAFGVSLLVNRTLRELYLKGYWSSVLDPDSSLRDEGGAAIGRALITNDKLIKLDLSFNDLGTESCKAFVESLSTNRTLQTLGLYNGFSEECIGALVPVIQANSVLTNVFLVGRTAQHEKIYELFQAREEDTQNRRLRAWAEVALASASFNAQPDNALKRSLLWLVPAISNLAGFTPFTSFNWPAHTAPTYTPWLKQTSSVGFSGMPIPDTSSSDAGDSESKTAADRSMGDKRDMLRSAASAAVAPLVFTAPTTTSVGFNIQKFVDTQYFANTFVDSKTRRDAEITAGEKANFLSSPFSAIALGLCNLIATGALRIAGDILNPLRHGKKMLDYLNQSPEDFMEWLKESEDDKRQRKLTPVFHKMAIDLIEENYQAYKQKYYAFLMSAFRLFKEVKGSESFGGHDVIRISVVHDFMLRKFEELQAKYSNGNQDAKVQAEQFEELKLWWEEAGKKLYFDARRKSAIGATDDIEIEALADFLEINLQMRKKDQLRILGQGYGIVSYLGGEQINHLTALRLGSPLHFKNGEIGFRIEGDPEKVRRILHRSPLSAVERKCLDEQGKRKILAYQHGLINNSAFPEIADIDSFCSKLKERGILYSIDGKIYRFVDENSLSCLAGETPYGLKGGVEQVLGFHKVHNSNVILEINFDGNCWSYQPQPKDRKTALVGRS